MTANNADREDLITRISAVKWYHTIDLGDGLVTPGDYDHRPYLSYYGIPDDLSNKTALDIGAASGFFSFEMERRGATVTATELPSWFDHDFSPVYQPDHTVDSGQHYLDEPMNVAIQALGSHVERKFLTIYDISPQTVGQFDLVFSGSVLIHLTDPARALWNIASVTADKAIIATVISPHNSGLPIAFFEGATRGDAWWVPTRSCLELMAVCAGFQGIEWFSDFRLDYGDGSTGPYHGVLHAYKTKENWSSNTLDCEEVKRHYANQFSIEDICSPLKEQVGQMEAQLAAQAELIHGYESGYIMRLLRWLHRLRA